jgi:hypothetical protein
MSAKEKAAAAQDRAASKYYAHKNPNTRVAAATTPTVSGLQTLLQRLERLRQTSPSRWTARCPGHRDRNPSLTIRETDDGTVLLHCFGGCPVQRVVEAVGLNLSDLFPRNLHDHRRKRERQSFVANDVLSCIRRELAIVVVVASDLKVGRTLNEADDQRFLLAVERITGALEFANA